MARLFVGQANETPSSLRKWNLALAGLNFIQGFAFLILSPARGIPITTTFLTRDTLQSSAMDHIVSAPSVRQLFVINLTYFFVTIFFVSAFWRLLMATLWFRSYEGGLTARVSKLRWVGQAFSLSAVVFAVSLLSGVYDLSTLLLFFVFMLIVSFLGFVSELHAQPTKADKTSLFFIVGCLLRIVPWVVILFYLIGAQIYGGGLVPLSTSWILVSAFILFGSFVVNAYLQHIRYGKWRAYVYGERWYVALSFIAKTILAWQVLALVLHS